MARVAKISMMCRTLHCLPGPGGLLQQDPYLIDAMSYVLEAIAEREEREQKRGSSGKRT